MDSKENVAFTAYLKDAASIVEKEGYTPQRFKSMLNADGGYEAVKRILEKGKPSEGFSRLFEMQKLNLTCEAIIVESKWRRYFDDDLLLRSEKLLRASNYPFKRYEYDADKPEPGALVPPPEVARQHEETRPGAASGDRARPLAPAIGINAFFEDVLNAPVANARWSWGAADPQTRRVFLRLWRDDVDSASHPSLVRVLDGNGRPGPGRTERERHLGLIKGGYTAYAVMCDKEGVEGKSILGYEGDELIELGDVIESGGSAFMAMLGSVTASSLPMPAERSLDLADDLHSLSDADIGPTARKALIEARLGQGRYRRELLRRWGGACAVTGCQLSAVLRASHCKPWRLSSDGERLDSHNGLILSANLDALFDVGLISFDGDGAMLVAPGVSPAEREQLQIPANLSRAPGQKLQGYLRFHREHVFLKVGRR